jgi:hypothetical protein
MSLGDDFTKLKAADTGSWRNYFDIVILPPPAIQNHAIGLSKRLEEYGGKFVLGRRRFIPHISLYHVPVRAQNFDSFSRAVREVAARCLGGSLRLTSVDMPVLMTNKPAWLTRLHRQMVANTCLFLDRDYDVEQTWHTNYLPAHLRAPARRYLRQFGSPLIHEVFRPHITLTSFEDRSIAPRIPPLNFEPRTFHVATVSICELGPSHTCQRTVATYRLKSSRKKAL